MGLGYKRGLGRPWEALGGPPRTGSAQGPVLGTPGRAPGDPYFDPILDPIFGPFLDPKITLFGLKMAHFWAQKWAKNDPKMGQKGVIFGPKMGHFGTPF